MRDLGDIVEPLCDWYEQAHRALPWREEQTPYRVWISEIMLQQTRVEAVKGYFARFLQAFPTVEALAQAPEQQLLKLWEGLGYYNRARNLQKAAQLVVERYGGQLPDTYEGLLELPGIGSYTAGAVASIAYGRPVPAVDGNVRAEEGVNLTLTATAAARDWQKGERAAAILSSGGLLILDRI